MKKEAATHLDAQKLCFLGPVPHPNISLGTREEDLGEPGVEAHIVDDAGMAGGKQLLAHGHLLSVPGVHPVDLAGAGPHKETTLAHRDGRHAARQLDLLQRLKRPRVQFREGSAPGAQQHVATETLHLVHAHLEQWRPAGGHEDRHAVCGEETDLEHIARRATGVQKGVVVGNSHRHDHTLELAHVTLGETPFLAHGVHRPLAEGVITAGDRHRRTHICQEGRVRMFTDESGVRRLMVCAIGEREAEKKSKQ